jgi:hypothetical protein
MGTTSSEVYDLFLMTVTDYRLITLYNTSSTDFENYLQAWLLFAINDFSVCDQDLTYDTVTKTFSSTLSSANMVILATLMMKYWLQKLVNDVTQMNLHITDRDFKVASEAQNLREKQAAFSLVKEQCSQLLNDYAYKRVSWSEWFNQDFDGA